MRSNVFFGKIRRSKNINTIRGHLYRVNKWACTSMRAFEMYYKCITRRLHERKWLIYWRGCVVEVETKNLMQSFLMFCDRAMISFFTRKIPMLPWIKEWLFALLQENCVKDEYVNPHGFIEVLLNSQMHQEKWLKR